MFNQLLKVIFNKLFNSNNPTNSIQGNGKGSTNSINNINNTTDNSTHLFINSQPSKSEAQLSPTLLAKRKLFNESLGVMIFVGGFIYMSYFLYVIFMTKSLNTFLNPFLLILCCFVVAAIVKSKVQSLLKAISNRILSNEKLLDNLLAYFDINLRHETASFQIEMLFLMVVLAGLLFTQVMYYVNNSFIY